ncbi:hypothetical protein ACET3X_002669 [Alternaria dauci]|uniref:Uncharacterized protein n=1 Tax=Alternaria dauci TaxID=48095 RepID=A0ABR3UQR7_9PLEO
MSDPIKRTQKHSSQSASRELTPEQLSQAQALANISLSNYQHPDDDLIKSMREKNISPSSQAVQHSAPFTLPTSSTSLSSPVDQLASDLPVSQLGPSKTYSINPQSPESAQPPPVSDDWEHLAKQDIIRKGLSLDKVWDRKTWKQKASNQQRLMLLKDDGYDITPLLRTKGKRVSADAIITALLDHIETRRADKADLASAEAAQTTPLPSVTGKEVSEPAQKISRGRHATHTTASKESRLSDGKSRMTAEALLPIAVPQEVPEIERMNVERRLFYTTPLAGMKRKHSHDDEHQPDWSELSPHKALHDSYNETEAQNLIRRPCTCRKNNKIMRMMTQEEVNEAFKEQAFDIVKRRICRDIFRESRAARSIRHLQASTSSSHYVAPSTPSRIVLQPPASLAHMPSEPHARISANGMHLIIEELKHIAYGCNEDSSMYFKDPEEAEDREGDRRMLAGETGEEDFRYHIRLYTTPILEMVIEGETMALIGLLKHLYERELTHYRPWRYDVDRVEMIAVDNVPWYLSDATRSTLKNLERLLETEQALGGAEIHLGYVSSEE